MKKLSYLLLIFSFVAFISCDDDNKSNDQFSDATPEQHKKDIQKDAVVVVTKLEAVQEHEAIQVMDEMFELLEDILFAQGVAPVLKSAKQMAQPQLFASASDEFIISSAFAEIAGIYVQNSSGELELEEESDSEFTVRFDSEIVDDCEFSLFGLKVQTVSNSSMSDDVSELPLALKAYLKAGALTLLDMNFSASYDSKDTPEKVDFSISMAPFTTALNFDRSKSKLSLDYSFKEGKDNIIALHLDSKGNFDFDKIEEMFDADFDSEEEAFAEQNVLNEANVWVAIGNLKADAFANFEGVKPALEITQGLDENSTIKDYEKAVDILNKNIKTFLRYTDSNEVIAKGAFIVEEESIFGYEYIDVGFVFEFSDGSLVDDSFMEDSLGEYMLFMASIMGEDWMDMDY